ncbi:hypothetical protein [uncultured Cellulomonas sp.]|uniref:hypothetical protein n=1 Tax=uncultured Cellulomonas sp. TaxID=189682 RepID=UPI0028EAF179|nr:hypothetical protein [uncultured Cellulomonas sp.]
MRRRLAMIALLAAAVVPLAGCGVLDDGGDQPSAAATVTATQVPAPAVTVTVEAPPPAEVLLTDQGVGSVALGGPAGAYDRLVELLGEATQPPQESCSFWLADWGSLTVYLDGVDGAATGWTLASGPLDDRVRPPFDIYPGDPLRGVLDAGGQTVPSYSWEDDAQVDEYLTSIGSYLWASETDDPYSPVSRIGVEAPGCE